MNEVNVPYCDGVPYGGNSSNYEPGEVISPKTHVWMNRCAPGTLVHPHLALRAALCEV